MHDKGHMISASQCISKMDALKRIYNKTKDHNSETGNERKLCNYYEELHELFSKKPWIRPLNQTGSNMPLHQINNSNTSVTASKCSRSTLDTHKIAYMEQCIEDKRLKRESTEAYRNKKMELMENLLKVLSQNKN